MLLLRHNLLKIRKGEPWQKSLNLMLRQKDLNEEDLYLQETVWKSIIDQPSLVADSALLNAAQNFTRLDNLASAEQIFQILRLFCQGSPLRIFSRLWRSSSNSNSWPCSLMAS